MKLAALAFRNIARNRRRSLLSGAAITLATLAIAFMFSYIGGIKVDLAKNAFIYDSGQIRLRNREYNRYETLNPLHLGVSDYRSVVSSLEKQENVRLVLPRIRFFSAIYREENNYRGMGLGIDFAREILLDKKAAGKDLAETSYRQMDQRQKLKAFASAWGLAGFKGELPEEGKRQVLLSSGLAEEMNVEVGDKVTFYTKTAYLGMQAWTFLVTGLIRFPIAGMNRSFFLAPLVSVQRFLKMDAVGNSVSEVLVHLKDLDRLDETALSILDLLSAKGFEDLAVQPWTEIGISYAWMELAEQIYNIVALFFFILGSTVIINTTIMVIFERMKEIGTIAAMGMTGGEIMTLFFLEAFFISLIAAFIGVALGAGITILLSIYGIDLGEAMSGTDFGMSSVFYPILSVRSTVFVFFYSVAVASLASFLPTRKAARIEPVEALRSL